MIEIYRDMFGSNPRDLSFEILVLDEYNIFIRLQWLKIEYKQFC